MPNDTMDQLEGVVAGQLQRIVRWWAPGRASIFGAGRSPLGDDEMASYRTFTCLIGSRAPRERVFALRKTPRQFSMTEEKGKSANLIEKKTQANSHTT
jgi:hypothetical protein